MARATFKLVEACSGTGSLIQDDDRLQPVRYRIDRYQGMLEGSGLPIPGLHRLEGTVAGSDPAFPERLVGTPLRLRLEDGRTLAITLISADGSVLAEGHGPGRGCACC